MAVIIRELQEFGNAASPRQHRVRVYRSRVLVTREAQRQAEELDRLLATRVREIVQELKANALLCRKGREGVLELWYELGKRLDFVSSLPVEPEEDREFIWRALYDYAKELVPSKPGSRSEKARARGTVARAERLRNNHFYYCYQLGKLPRGLVMAGGDWTSWSEFLDSTRIRSDPRIVEWLVKRSQDKPSEAWQRFTAQPRQKWFRVLTREIRQRFKKIDTTVLGQESLFAKLDSVFEKTVKEALVPAASPAP